MGGRFVWGGYLLSRIFRFIGFGFRARDPLRFIQEMDLIIEDQVLLVFGIGEVVIPLEEPEPDT